MYSCTVSSSKGRIHGTIMDLHTSEYIRNAWVIAVTDEDDGSEMEVCSGCSGQFILEGLEEGEYNITIIANDYEIFTIDVPVSKGKTSTADIHLTKDDNLMNAEAVLMHEINDPTKNQEIIR